MRTLRNRITLLAALAVTGTSLLATATASADSPGSVTSYATASSITVCVTEPYFTVAHRYAGGGGTTCFTLSG